MITANDVKSDVYETRAKADYAARKAMRKMHGNHFRASAKVDFIVDRAPYLSGWRYEIINLNGHLAEANGQ